MIVAISESCSSWTMTRITSKAQTQALSIKVHSLSKAMAACAFTLHDTWLTRSPVELHLLCGQYPAARCLTDGWLH